ncbi:MAG TPA: glycosyltransferase family 2 protein, partial [Methanotrichaceae archaeon]|nr:glycosyltransferase family 2 protein [Methanotrichaceae archaeon]
MGQSMNPRCCESREDPPRVSVIILNWNGWRDTEDCLRSLAGIYYRNYDIIVVDNGSTDESKQELTKFMQDMARASNAQDEGTLPVSFFELSSGDTTSKMPDIRGPGQKMVLIKSGENYGFAKGNNIGIEFALRNFSSDYVLLLNSDTIVEADFLGELVKVGVGDDTVGSIQSLLLKPGGMAVDSLGHEPKVFGTEDIGIKSAYTEGLLPGDVEIFGPCAAAALYRSEALKRVGLLDEGFFLIYEDVDLSWRLRLGGFKSVLAPRSVVYHKRGISAGRTSSEEMALLRKYHNNKNWLMLAVRYYPLRYILPLPSKYLRLIGRCMIYSAKLGRTGEISSLFLSSFGQRMANRKNPLLKVAQDRWIKDTRA